MRFSVAAVLAVASTRIGVSALTWGTTDYLFVFGDSYTTTGFNISAGVNSPTPGFTSSNGPNWVQYLGDTYNVTNTKIFNLAYGGAVTDNKLVTPYLPTVLSLVDQVAQFVKYLSSKPTGAKWSSSNSLFAIWIGINDNNVTQSGFHNTIMNDYFKQVETLYDHGTSFLFLNVPPIDRTPLFIEQGPAATAAVKASLADYNKQLSQRVALFKATHSGLGQVILFDAAAVFNSLLDNAATLGFVNSTGYVEAYENGTPSTTTQIAPYAPVSNYFWLNTLHPLFTVHNILAHAISTKLSGF
ncbi:carbohydrate esterase family 16 protein [Sistotremastrum niveocremeum HHB9708]|uniref:Carbohydrate esterase family 16 protein n=2 Tax=Sistotremastraceae TaxID=3402574 RepID=A0A164QWG6_9AGAM|nr:carbohydrate esterase family 16 protein [Sistotremastrum niveocremeum HHB9708]KZT39262.1 carbohydrate esterase family 16 protein [Sistotremastrum suecicum HHB10207 ss-3]